MTWTHGMRVWLSRSCGDPNSRRTFLKFSSHALGIISDSSTCGKYRQFQWFYQRSLDLTACKAWLTCFYHLRVGGGPEESLPGSGRWAAASGIDVAALHPVYGFLWGSRSLAAFIDNCIKECLNYGTDNCTAWTEADHKQNNSKQKLRRSNLAGGPNKKRSPNQEKGVAWRWKKKLIPPQLLQVHWERKCNQGWGWLGVDRVLHLITSSVVTRGSPNCQAGTQASKQAASTFVVAHIQVGRGEDNTDHPPK